MPAETHSHREKVDAQIVLDFLAGIVGVDTTVAADVRLADLHVDDDLSILHLWDDVVEEFGERTVGDLDLDGSRPATLGELAALFDDSLRS